MRQAKFVVGASALVALLAFATWSVAQESTNKGSNQNQNQNQDQSSDQQTKDSQQDRSQSSSSDKNASQQSDDRNNRDSNKSQNQADRDRDSRSNRDAESSRDSSSRSDDRERRDSDASRSERGHSDRDRDYDRDSRSTSDRSRTDDRSSRDTSSRDRSSSRGGDMRGPDIGLWFSRSGNNLVIADVSSKGAIAKVGFREGDRIVSVNGHRVANEREFIDYVFHSDADRVKVVIIRDNREETIYIEPAVFVREYDYVEVDPLERFGIIVDDRYDDRIVVWKVIPRSPAYYAGFRAGDVIVKFDGRPYRTRTEFERSARDWKAGEIGVQVRRNDRTRDLMVDYKNKDSDRSSDRNNRRDDRSVRTASGQSESGTESRSSDQRYENQSNQQQNNRRGGGLLRGRNR